MLKLSGVTSWSEAGCELNSKLKHGKRAPEKLWHLWSQAITNRMVGCDWETHGDSHQQFAYNRTDVVLHYIIGLLAHVVGIAPMVYVGLTEKFSA